MTGPVRVFPLAAVADLCPEPNPPVLGVEPADIVTLITRHLKAAGIQIRPSFTDLDTAAAQASALLRALGAPSGNISGHVTGLWDDGCAGRGGQPGPA